MTTLQIVAIVVVALVLLFLFFFFRRGVPGEAARGRTGPSAAPTAGRREAPTRADRPGGAAGPAEPAAPASIAEGDVELEEPRAESAVRGAAPGAREAPAGRRSEPPRPPVRGADVQTLRRGLARSRDAGGVFGKLKALFGGNRQIDAGLAREIEEVLLSSDVGASTTQTLLARLREGLDRGELQDPGAVWKALRQEAVQMLSVGGTGRESAGIEFRGSPTVVLFVGVNGAGKTTTIGKLATQLQAAGKKCVLAAGDTFRAAAVQQLVIWGRRVGCEVVHGKDGADPASVLFDAINKARELGADVVLADTAGRLHTKANLMNEMQKIARSAGKALNGAPHEIFLVIDSTNGQNALAQAREFKEALNVTGIVLTKLDGTAKGGVVLGISDSLRVPVRFVGMGEGPDDLHPFIPQRFVDALLGDEQAS
ncbi:MAG TPA: signal recognition particle-docking protein FtsY [Polyangiaceae bacterium]|nr:signal recognition particle-docking protein FtsY [Polyangiaceae bacterium]